MTQITENRDDTKRALAMHKPDGELYIVEYCSLWNEREAEVFAGYDTSDPETGQTQPATYTVEEQDCVGTRIIAATGPIVRRDLLGEDADLSPSVEAFDRIDAWQDLTDEDAEWLQAEEDAGRLDYPIGVR